MTSPLLDLNGVRKRFGATLALDGVDLRVQAGRVHALVGENGAGKSTLMKLLSGAEIPDAGEIRLAGLPYHPADTREARRKGVAMVYQELSLAPHLSVEENLWLGMEPSKAGFVDRRRLRAQSLQVLAEAGFEGIDPASRAGSLPLALQQGVEIARAVAGDCRLLILDEPTSSLGRPETERLFALIRRLREKGVGVIYISHFLEEAREVADQYTVLRDGKSVGSGTMARDTDLGQIVRLMVDRDMGELFPPHARRPGEKLLEISELAGRTKPVSASLTLHRGEVLGLAGLVGAGRSELIRLVFGLDQVRSGQIKLGIHVGAAAPHERILQKAGMVSEDRKGEGLAPGMSIADNLTLSRQDAFNGPAWREREGLHWMRELDLRAKGPGQKVAELSGGNQQKVALARLLHSGADLLLLDEPTRGIDVASKSQIYKLIGRLADEGRAVLMVSSYLPELLGVCDRIAVMRKGVLGPARPASAWTEHSILMEAALGDALED